MPRTKGSKNKPKPEKKRFTLSDGWPDEIEQTQEQNQVQEQKESQTQQETTPEEQPKKKRHRRTKAEMEAYRASLNLQEAHKDVIDTLQSTLENGTEALNSSLNESTESDSLDLTPENYIVKKSRIASEPEDDKLPILKSEPLEIKEDKQNIIEKIKTAKSQKNKKIYPLCDCCATEIYSQPHRIDTNILTAQVPDYHRVSPRWVNLCSACALKLSDVVDKWLSDNGCMTAMEQRELEKKKVKDKDGE